MAMKNEKRCHWFHLLYFVEVVITVTAFQRSTNNILLEISKQPRQRPSRIPHSFIPYDLAQRQRRINLGSSRTATMGGSSENHFEEYDFLKGVDDVLIQTASSLGLSRDSILEEIDRQHSLDAKACLPYLTPEESNKERNGNGILEDASLSYEWIYTPDENDDANDGSSYSANRRRLVLRTTGEPVLDDDTISWIRQQAERQWNNKDMSSSSRFTYQRPGNYEAHLADLIQWNCNNGYNDKSTGGDLINRRLQESIYPTIRKAFGSYILSNREEGEGEDPDQLSLCLYDAIVIRYNATEAQLTNKNIGFDGRAGQPLHRDLGLVSVNIMLNSNDEFDGGGTFFEDQLLSSNVEEAVKPVRPIGPGHAVMHLSSDRHAGSGIYGGVRDILVMFVTAASTDNLENNEKIPYHLPKAPRLERCARLKSLARPASQVFEDPLDAALCRAYYQRLAVIEARNDGEAWHYLGMAFWDCYNAATQNEGREGLFAHRNSFATASISCLEKASELTPCDARLFNNLGLICGQASSMNMTISSQVEQHYERAIALHRASKMAGCDVGPDFDAAKLNYGLWLANQDEFRRSVNILSQINNGRNSLSQEQENGVIGTTSDPRHLRIIEDAGNLLRYCQGQLVH